jgi:hypothetical protein
LLAEAEAGEIEALANSAFTGCGKTLSSVVLYQGMTSVVP